MSASSPKRFVISGGGTGGHIFPAVAIAQTILRRLPDAEILFVGALGRMEMEKVPAAGFRIVGLPIVGIQRRLTWKNLLVPIRVLQSLWRARKILREFKPDVAIGVGGYASGPLLRAAGYLGIPTVIQEQNSYPGVTNRLLAAKASVICVAYDGLERYFPADKIVKTGNPVRRDVVDVNGKKAQACEHFQVNPNQPIILVIGGSLGARTINEAVAKASIAWQQNGYQVIWQTGKGYYQQAKDIAATNDALHVHEFIREMDLAYSAADLVVSRAGAMSISELCLVAKPTLFVPSPNVSEDHQTKNAMALVYQGAALLVKDNDALGQLEQAVIDLLNQPHTLKSLATAMEACALPSSDERIVDEVLKVIENV